jgi:transcriptional regulator with XRE-family HTH domain
MGYGQLVKKIRARMGLSQDQFAERFGTNQGTVSKWESEEQQIGNDRLNQMLGVLDKAWSIENCVCLLPDEAQVLSPNLEARIKAIVAEYLRQSGTSPPEKKNRESDRKPRRA